ncbi:NAD(P)-binding protein [Mollisia scopiformis]|uniref:NAD(P)-binding protein n=1 Tax=Mollisia scopiformis TaxID=149040 RepID=A0A194XAM6_MOLSC|nr:NAD(P)-binding protein [Mollisia scopiformis]KUJ17225.1 NAD(P)-binding protein [Mollisia scopiformis]
MGNSFSQIFPPKPQFTENNLPDQTGKVFIVTGASTGVGLALAELLYSHNAKVYVAARSSEKATKAISSIQTAHPKSNGELIYLHLDLDDLTTIKASANDFLSKETRLDVLWNNAGVMNPAPGSRTKQGYELQIGTNNVAPFLFTKLLTPILIKTAKSSPTGSVRVVWVSSSAAEFVAPKGGVDMTKLDGNDKSVFKYYGLSKGGNILHNKEFARRFGGEGVISVALNPGNLKTPLYRTAGSLQNKFLNFFILHEPIFGAYTELFGGLSSEITPEMNGTWVVPWGRFAPLREDYEASFKSKDEGGTGLAREFWEWTEEQVKAYL